MLSHTSRVSAVRTSAAAGCRTIVLTNGCGGLNPAWTPGTPLPWDVVQSGVSENYFHYELRLAAQDQTGLSCPPDSAGCLACQACDPNWAFRYGDNANRPVPAAKGGPWRAEDWLPWTQLKASAIDVQAK